MAGKKTAVFGIYKNSAEAENAVDRVLAAGVGDAEGRRIEGFHGTR